MLLPSRLLLMLLPLRALGTQSSDPNDGGVVCPPESSADTHIDPSIAERMISAFCSTHCLNGEGIKINETYGGQNLTPPVEIDNVGVYLEYHAFQTGWGNAMQKCTSNFTTDAAKCEERFNKIMTSCEYDSHDYYGFNTLIEPCGMWQLLVLNCTQHAMTTWPNGTLFGGWCGPWS